MKTQTPPENRRRGSQFAHGEHIAAPEQRRQDFEHLVVIALADLEPLAGITAAGLPGSVDRCLAVAIEERIHLLAAGDALQHLADLRICGWRTGRSDIGCSFEGCG